MRITGKQLRQIIKEEIMREADDDQAVNAVNKFYSKHHKNAADLENAYNTLASEMKTAGVDSLTKAEEKIEKAGHDPSSMAQDVWTRMQKISK